MLLNERSWTQKYILCDFNYATLEKAKLPWQNADLQLTMPTCGKDEYYSNMKGWQSCSSLIMKEQATQLCIRNHRIIEIHSLNYLINFAKNFKI
jgi:hypothetical protein